MTEGELAGKVEERMQIEGKQFEPVSPLEEARNLNKQLSEQITALREERAALEKMHAELQMAGRGVNQVQAKEMTQQEKDMEAAEAMAQSFK